MLNKKNIIEFVKNYKWILIIFIIFLAFQIFETTYFFWDPFVYQLNGKWLCGEQIYFEFLRPPLPSAVNCLVGAGENSILLTQIVASFTYLVAAIILFKKEIKKRKINQMVYSLFIFLAPQIFLFGNYGGDFFAVALLMIAISINGYFRRGFIFGLATLSRYNFFFYAVLLADYSELNLKQVLKIGAGIIVTWIPWMAYNFYHTGNALFSVEETTYLNFLVKGVFAPVGLYEIGLVIFFLVIFMLGKYQENAKDKKAQAGFIALAQFIFSGIKEARFLNVFVPFQASKIGEIVNKNRIAKIFFILLIISIFFITSFSILTRDSPPEIPSQDFIYNCRVMSENWVYLYKEGIIAEPLAGEDSYYYFLENGVSLVFYDKYLREKEFDFGEFEKIETKDYTIIKSNACAPQPDKYELRVWRGDNPQE